MLEKLNKVMELFHCRDTNAIKRQENVYEWSFQAVFEETEIALSITALVVYSICSDYLNTLVI